MLQHALGHAAKTQGGTRQARTGGGLKLFDSKWMVVELCWPLVEHKMINIVRKGNVKSEKVMKLYLISPVFFRK